LGVVIYYRRCRRLFSLRCIYIMLLYSFSYRAIAGESYAMNDGGDGRKKRSPRVRFECARRVILPRREYLPTRSTERVVISYTQSDDVNVWESSYNIMKRAHVQNSKVGKIYIIYSRYHLPVYKICVSVHKYTLL